MIAWMAYCHATSALAQLIEITAIFTADGARHNRTPQRRLNRGLGRGCSNPSIREGDSEDISGGVVRFGDCRAAGCLKHKGPEQIFQEISRSIVTIHNMDCDDNMVNLGSGEVTAAETAMTNCRLLNGGQRYSVHSGTVYCVTPRTALASQRCAGAGSARKGMPKPGSTCIRGGGTARKNRFGSAS